jgi:hypothetical protein
VELEAVVSVALGGTAEGIEVVVEDESAYDDAMLQGSLESILEVL